MTESVLWTINCYTDVRWYYYCYSACFLLMELFLATECLVGSGPHQTLWHCLQVFYQGAISCRSPEDFKKQRHWRLSEWMLRNHNNSCEGAEVALRMSIAMDKEKILCNDWHALAHYTVYRTGYTMCLMLCSVTTHLTVRFVRLVGYPSFG